MTAYRSILASSISAWWCCPDCDAVALCCPGCSEPLTAIRPNDHPPALPFHMGLRCPDRDCSAALSVTVCGYRPNPTGDVPATRSPLSDPLPVAERHRPVITATPRPRPAARRPSKRTTAPPQRPTITARLPSGERNRLAIWAAWGWLPDGVNGSSIAAAYTRACGRPAPRDPSRPSTRAYSVLELGLALAELGLAFEAQPLSKAWQQILQRLKWPSIRMLLSDQARLLELRAAPDLPETLLARVGVRDNWLVMVESRRQLLAEAATDTLGQPVVVVLEREVTP